MTKTIVEVSGSPLVDKMQGSPELDVVVFLGEGVEVRMSQQQAVTMGTQLVSLAYSSGARPDARMVRVAEVVRAAAVLAGEALYRGAGKSAVADAQAEIEN